ncbi:hypothetical protein BDW75DRAFT_224405 [Aspergillus navahoensis]
MTTIPFHGRTVRPSIFMLQTVLPQSTNTNLCRNWIEPTGEILSVMICDRRLRCTGRLALLPA